MFSNSGAQPAAEIATEIATEMPLAVPVEVEPAASPTAEAAVEPVAIPSTEPNGPEASVAPPAPAPPRAAAVEVIETTPPETPPATTAAVGTVDEIRVGLVGEMPLDAELVVETSDGQIRRVRAAQLRIQGAPAGVTRVSLVASGEELGQDEVTVPATALVRLLCKRTQEGHALACTLR
jgi:hypothetical protein